MTVAVELDRLWLIRERLAGDAIRFGFAGDKLFDE